jgi:hypothetical protein
MPALLTFTDISLDISISANAREKELYRVEHSFLLFLLLPMPGEMRMDVHFGRSLKLDRASRGGGQVQGIETEVENEARVRLLYEH